MRPATLFDKKVIKTTLIEQDSARCGFLAVHLNNTLILHGDGTDKNLLAEEHAGNKDAFVAVTGDEKTNRLCCLLAKSMGVKETVVRVNKAAYLPYELITLCKSRGGRPLYAIFFEEQLVCQNRVQE